MEREHGSTYTDLDRDEARRLVRRHALLSDSGKLLWDYLFFDLLRGQLGSVNVTTSEIAPIFGKSHSSAGRWFKSLDGSGLATVEDPTITGVRGVWRITLLCPLELERLRLVRPSPQRELFVADEAAPLEEPTTAEGSPSPSGPFRVAPGTYPDGETVAAEPCAAPAPPSSPARATRTESAAKNSARICIHNRSETDVSAKACGTPSERLTRDLSLPSPSDPSEELPKDVAEGRASAAPAQPPRAAPSTAGESALAVVAQIAARRPKSQEQLRAEVEALIARIQRDVRDPALRAEPCRKIAYAICEGMLPAREHAECVARLNQLDDAGQIKFGRYAYYVGRMKKKCRFFGVDWPDQARAKGGRE